MGAVVGLSSGGRPRLPTAAKELRGTLRPSRENAAAPELPVAKLGQPPEALSAEEREVWFELAPLVQALRVATKADRPAFRALVSALSACRLAYRTADLKSAAALDPRVEKWLSHFGLTPATRSKVSRIEGPAPKSAVSEFSGR